MKYDHLKILIVDDSLVNRKLIASIIQKNIGCSILLANDGTAALQLSQDELPDLILLDVMMPGMDGFSVAEHLQADEKTAHIPIIFITALTDEENKVRGFEKGGRDYVTKPFNKKEVLVRIKSQLDLKQKMEEIENLNRSLLEELTLAESVQQAILPAMEYHSDQVEIECRYIPFTEVSGDYFDILPLAGDKLAIFLTDVTGHGVPAALYTMYMKAQLQNIVTTEKDPVCIMQALNENLFRVLTEDFLPTAVLVVLDFAKQELTYVSAGHHFPYFYSAQNQTVAEMPSKNVFLGFDEQQTFLENKLPFQSGDRILIYTDGIVEVQDTQNQLEGQKILRDYIVENRYLTLSEFVPNLIQVMREISQTGKFEDDATVIAVEIK